MFGAGGGDRPYTAALCLAVALKDHPTGRFKGMRGVKVGLFPYAGM